jgi:arginyl-tRNA synthetase
MLSIKGLEERGESFYNPYLNNVVQDLEKQGLAVESEGATAVFLEGVSKTKKRRSMFVYSNER